MKVKVAGYALMGILAMLVIPANSSGLSNSHIDGPSFYGAANLIQKDAAGNEIFSQTVHNRLLDAGEIFLLNQTFQEVAATTVAENQQIGSICISLGTPTIEETLTVATFDSADGISGDENCIQDTEVDIVLASEQAQIGPLTFTCGGTNCQDTNTITVIGICQNRSADNNAYETCVAGGDGTTGILFAAVDVTDTTLGAAETVDITYTFDISSDSS